MTKVPLLEAQIREMDSGATPPVNDTEALFEEACRRRFREAAPPFGGVKDGADRARCGVLPSYH